MPVETGKIDAISRKKTKTNNDMYGLMINEKWFSTFEDPGFNEGDYVAVDYSKKGQYNNINKNGISAVKAPEGVKKPSNPSMNSRDVSIQYQSSRKDAIAIVQMLLEQTAAPLPTKKEDRYGAILGLVDEVTAKLYIDLESVIANGGVDAVAPEPAGAGDNFDDDIPF